MSPGAWCADKLAGRGGDRKWLAASAFVVALVVAPVVSLAFIASRGSGDLWPHIVAFVLPQALWQTALLLTGVGVIVVTLGASLAWLMTAYEFPGRRIFDWALLLPLATPTYIVAFAYLDLLHPLGPIQSGLRALLGIEDVRGRMCAGSGFRKCARWPGASCS
jgi:iron(III) transport system permease protein